MQRKRFFILDETCSSLEIPSMMCRVVQDKLLPLSKYAPFEPINQPEVPRHNTQDIIPNILPKPDLTNNRRDFLNTIQENTVKVYLKHIFGLDFIRSEHEQLFLESQKVNRYTLNNSDAYFKRLMENALYARDVQALLESTGHEGYLIVGFLTTTGSNWARGSTGITSRAAAGTIPLAEGSGFPISGVDPQIAYSQKSQFSYIHTEQALHEEIFAVSYRTVKLVRVLDKWQIKKSVSLGQIKRAGAHHLALSDKNDEGSDEEGEEDNVPDIVLLKEKLGIKGELASRSFMVDQEWLDNRSGWTA